MNDCIFCKIDKGEIPSKKIYEDENMFIIADIDPRANKHYLMIPHAHYKLLAEMTDENAPILSLVKLPSSIICGVTVLRIFLTI